MIREKFDYTKWRRAYFSNITLEEINAAAASYAKEEPKPYKVAGKSILEILREQMEIRLPGQLYHATQIDMAYNSNRIEGSTLSHEETRYIYETRSIIDSPKVNVDDVIETSNHFILFNYMLKTADQALTEEMIKTYHQILKSGTKDAMLDWFNVGEYKTLANTIGGIVETTEPADVSKQIKTLLEAYHAKESPALKDIVDFHWKFERIHPFQDGNGRVGRMIMLKECLANDIMPFVVLDADKAFYYKGLQEYPDGTRLLDTCLHFQDLYREKVKKFFPD